MSQHADKEPAHVEFFSEDGQTTFNAYIGIHRVTTISVEQFYQHFKARMMAELVACSDELLRPAELVNKQEEA